MNRVKATLKLFDLQSRPTYALLSIISTAVQEHGASSEGKLEAFRSTISSHVCTLFNNFQPARVSPGTHPRTQPWRLWL